MSTPSPRVAWRVKVDLMARGRKATLHELDPWLDEVSRVLGIEGLIEKANGAFDQRRNGILHFHEDAEGVHADAEVVGEWRLMPIDRAAGRREVLRLLRAQYT